MLSRQPTGWLSIQPDTSAAVRPSMISTNPPTCDSMCTTSRPWLRSLSSTGIFDRGHDHIEQPDKQLEHARRIIPQGLRIRQA